MSCLPTTRPEHNKSGPISSLIALFYFLQATAKTPMQSLSYSVRSACIGSMEAARRAGMWAATRAQIVSRAQAEKMVTGSCWLTS